MQGSPSVPAPDVSSFPFRRGISSWCTKIPKHHQDINHQDITKAAYVGTSPMYLGRYLIFTPPNKSDHLSVSAVALFADLSQQLVSSRRHEIAATPPMLLYT